MNILHRTAGILGLGVVWMVIWGAIGAPLAIVVGIIDPHAIGPGEGPVDLARIIGVVGGASGLVFGLLLTIGERRSEVAEVPLLRAVMWGVVAGAALPLLSISDANLANTCVLGAVSGVVTLGLAAP